MMTSNVVHMTLTNESVMFTSDGIKIQPVNSDAFWFGGSAQELISIMVYHHDLEIDNVRFRVREHECGFCRGRCDGIHYVSSSTIGY